MHIRTAAVACFLALGLAGPTATGFAQEHGADHGQPARGLDHDGMMEGMEHDGASAVPDAGHAPHRAEASGGSPATQAYLAANRDMHAAMDIDFTDDPDVDFARGMIGHHQGAIDMARIVIAHGDDPELRRLAEEIIAAQEGEIAFLEAWLSRNGQ